MELNYDYESYDGSKNSNFYVRYCGDQIKIEGTPTEIGVWIYAPENTPCYSLYADIMFWKGSDYGTKITFSRIRVQMASPPRSLTGPGGCTARQIFKTLAISE